MPAAADAGDALHVRRRREDHPPVRQVAAIVAVDVLQVDVLGVGGVIAEVFVYLLFPLDPLYYIDSDTKPYTIKKLKRYYVNRD